MTAIEVSDTQRKVLEVLIKGDKPRGELSDEVGLPYPELNPLLKRLHDLDLIAYDFDDRFVLPCQVFKITEKGKRSIYEHTAPIPWWWRSKTQ